MIICDTGPLVAVLNADDADHQRCTDLLEGQPGPLLVPSPVVAEICYMAETRVGPAAEAAFLRSLASGELEFAELSTVILLVLKRAGVPRRDAMDESHGQIRERLRPGVSDLNNGGDL